MWLHSWVKQKMSSILKRRWTDLQFKAHYHCLFDSGWGFLYNCRWYYTSATFCNNCTNKTSKRANFWTFAKILLGRWSYWPLLAWVAECLGSTSYSRIKILSLLKLKLIYVFINLTFIYVPSRYSSRENWFSFFLQPLGLSSSRPFIFIFQKFFVLSYYKYY